MSRIVVLYMPSLLGLSWQNEAALSIIWSLVGSAFIALTSQTHWFKQSFDTVPLKMRLLRPEVTFQFFFVAANVIGDMFYILNAAGFASWQRVTVSTVSDLQLLAIGQSLMLFAHANVTVGMKLAGCQYPASKFRVRDLPRGVLLSLSFALLVAGGTIGAFPGLEQVGLKLLQLSAVAVLLELTYALAQKEIEFAIVTIGILASNLMAQVLSGWKGLILWTMLTLGALLYPMMPRRIIWGGVGFVLFWLLFLHPFGLAYRPLYWNQGMKQSAAASISFEQTLNMTLLERFDNVWNLMVERASEMYQLQKYLNFVPNSRPYYGWELAQESLYGLVPRILWRDKPEFERLAMRRVYDAGIVLERDEATVSAKANFYQDGYLSAGGSGVGLASLLFGFVMMSISRLCERLFGGYEIGTCFIFTALFGEIVKNPPPFLFFVGTAWSSFLVMGGLFVFGKLTGWIVPVTSSIAVSENSRSSVSNLASVSAKFTH